MTYMKPEMEIEKFDLIEEITADADSAAAAGNDPVQGGNGGENGGNLADQSIGNDLIIG